jgi:cytochrome b6-f complex iron-sulfur subunit
MRAFLRLFPSALTDRLVRLTLSRCAPAGSTDRVILMSPRRHKSCHETWTMCVKVFEGAPSVTSALLRMRQRMQRLQADSGAMLPRHMSCTTRRTMHTRRVFCVHACQAASVAAIGSILNGCGGSSSPSSPSGGAVPQLPTANSTVSSNQVSLTIDSASPLASVGSAALVQNALGQFLVARVGQDSFTALTAICTHQTCTVTGFSNQRYVCPCHGSEYDTSGRVVTGPAPTALRTFPTVFANNVLTFTV